MNRRILFAAIAAVSVSVSVRADGPNVWYVKASNYGLEGLTGEDEEHAWGTLQQAHDAAKEVKRWGDPIKLPEMNAHDRRIVHLALKDDPEVVTESEGDGVMRQVVISLKKQEQ